jgi:hypothetical protein
MIIIIVAILGTLILGCVIGLIVYFKCRKAPQIGQKQTVKGAPVSDDSGKSPDVTDNLEVQYHPKVEIGNIFLNGQI